MQTFPVRHVCLSHTPYATWVVFTYLLKQQWRFFHVMVVPFSEQCCVDTALVYMNAALADSGMRFILGE